MSIPDFFGDGIFSLLLGKEIHYFFPRMLIENLSINKNI